MKKKIIFGVMALFLAALLAACGNSSEETESSGDKKEQEEQKEDTEGGMGHSAEEMSSDDSVPDGLKKAEDPEFAIGDKAEIKAEHMKGMKGAESTISGAFNTTVYTVSYTPTNGGDPVKNHKWVIHEEFENPGEAPMQEGDEAVMTATHMKGMEGATATIDSAKETTVYMVDFTTTDTEEQVENHKWVTEDELAPAEQ
ncbi:YdhK family protein [Salimicrobium jeotgali]|uniref:YdhK family protein n=1 Tax=Salimicrobium jeotgali TaxID=1230341 RepID=UPI000C818D7A|nr:YdhK family protein [Salimicrobium jeotgali]